LDAASEPRVWDTAGVAREELRAANREAENAADAAARPAALAAGLQALTSGAALILGLVIGISAATAGNLSGPGAAVVALTPLAAFEAVGAVPNAMSQYFRSRFAARRVKELTHRADAIASVQKAITPVDSSPATPQLELVGLRAGWRATDQHAASSPTLPVSLTIAPGSSVGIVGRSGIGKTTLMLTMAGALSPIEGKVLLNGRPVTQSDTGAVIAMTAEDAHLFGTSVLENLRVARGDVTVEEAADALATVGLRDWLAMLPAGLDSVLGSGGNSVSGGERRRLLLARVLVTHAPVHLIDEPGEHLDLAGRRALRAVLDTMRGQGRTVVLVTHDLDLLDRADQVVNLDD
jgi:ATP-binding cassette subfamily C protein CydC